MRKKHLGILLVLLVLVGGVTFAWSGNWKWFLKTTGVVRKAEVTWEAVIINLGDLYAGQKFEASTMVEITSTCVNVSVTNVLMVVEYSYVATYKEAERYLEECFVDLTLNITINGITTSIPIIVNGRFNDQSVKEGVYWKYLNTTADYSHFNSSGGGYPYYITVGFPSYEIHYGKQAAYVVVYGQAGYPEEDHIFNICWYLEITSGMKNATTS